MTEIEILGDAVGTMTHAATELRQAIRQRQMITVQGGQREALLLDPAGVAFLAMRLEDSAALLVEHLRAKTAPAPEASAPAPQPEVTPEHAPTPEPEVIREPVDVKRPRRKSKAAI